jgi:ribosomal protein L32
MKKVHTLSALLIVLLAFAVVMPVMAQDEQPELEINLTRDFGYGGFGNDIQGTFTIKVSGPDDLIEVAFYLDDVLIGTDDESPFRLQFKTDSYEPGLHTIYAVGTRSDGTKLETRQLIRDFLSSEEANSKTINIVGPILGITAVVMVISYLIPMLTGKNGAQRPIGQYSAAGGTVCPRCGFPFSRNVLSPNLVLGKLERCPHCGKWSIRARASQADLFAAEERLRAAQEENTPIETDPEESLKRALDESRFED